MRNVLTTLVLVLLGNLALAPVSRADAASFVPGQTLVIANPYASGANVRYGSGLQYRVQTFLHNGTRVVLKGGPRQASGYTWYDITGYGNSGWIVSYALASAPSPRRPITTPPAVRPAGAAPAQPRADVVPAQPRADVRIESVSFSSRTVTAADYLEVRVGVRNAGSVAADTWGWEPGSRHELYDVAPAAPRGRWRVGLECGSLSRPGDHQWRFGFGSALAPGEGRVVSLYIHPWFVEPVFEVCWVGVVEELVAWHADLVARTALTFGGGSARDVVGDYLRQQPYAAEVVAWTTGFRIEDKAAWEKEPLLAAVNLALPVLPVGRLLASGYRFAFRGGREVLYNPAMQVVASAGIWGGKAYIGEVWALSVAHDLEGFRTLDNWIHETAGHGPDAIGFVGRRLSVLEAKFRCSGQLALTDLGDEMTQSWLVRNAPYAGSAAGAFADAARTGSVVRILVVTRCGGNAAGIAADVLQRFDIAYELAENGRVLKRYGK